MRGGREQERERERRSERGTYFHSATATVPVSNPHALPDKPSRDNKDRENGDVRNTPEQPPSRRSASPKQGLDKDTNDRPQLPTRSKPASAAPTPPAPVSFKVKNRDGSHGPEPARQQQSAHEDGHDDGERHQTSRGRFDAEPMDEDDDEELVVEDDGLDDMAAMMGFGGFGTTKNKKVLGNNSGMARKEKKTEYRQYMNRVGGFNRPLSPGR